MPSGPGNTAPFTNLASFLLLPKQRRASADAWGRGALWPLLP